MPHPKSNPMNASDIFRRRMSSGAYLRKDATRQEMANFIRYNYIDGNHDGSINPPQSRGCTNDPSDNGVCNCGCFCEDMNFSNACECVQPNMHDGDDGHQLLNPRPLNRLDNRRFVNRNNLVSKNSSELKQLYKEFGSNKNMRGIDPKYTKESYTSMLGLHWPPNHDKSRCRGLTLDECIERIMGISHSSYSGIMNSVVNENSKQFIDSWYWTMGDPCDYYGCSPANCKNIHMKNFCDEGLPHLQCCSPEKTKDRLPTLQDRLRTQEDTYNHLRQQNGNFYSTRVIRHMSRVERESTRNSGLFDSPMGVAWYKKYLNSIIGGGFSHGTEICSPDNQCTNVWCDDTSNCKTKDLHSALCEAWPDAFCNYDGFVEPPGYNPLTAYVSTPTQALMNGSGGTIPISGNLFSFKPQWVKINLSSVDRVNKNLTISMAGSNFDGRIFAFRDINNIYFPYIESNLLASPDIIGWGKHCGGHGFDNTCDRGASAPIRSDWYMDDPCVCTDTYDYPNIYSQNPDCAEKNPTEYGSDYFGDKINWTYPVYGTRLYNGSGEYDDCGCAYFDGRGALDGGFVDCSGSDSDGGLCTGVLNCPQLTIPLNGDGYSGIEQGIRNYIWVAIHAGWDDCDWATDLNEMYGLNPPIVAPTCGDFKLHYWIHDNSGNGIGPTPTPTPTPTPGHDMMTHHIPT